MTEDDKYSKLEDSLTWLNFALQMSWWRRIFKFPTQELKNAVEDLHSSISTVSQLIEFCKTTNKDRYLKLLRKAENKLFNTLRQYSSLNKWNYLLKFKWPNESDQ